MKDSHLEHHLKDQNKSKHVAKDLEQKIMALIAEIKQGRGNMSQLLYKALDLMSMGRGLEFPDYTSEIESAFMQGIMLKKNYYMAGNKDIGTKSFFEEYAELTEDFNHVFIQALANDNVSKENAELLLQYLDNKEEREILQLRAKEELDKLSSGLTLTTSQLELHNKKKADLISAVENLATIRDYCTSFEIDHNCADGKQERVVTSANAILDTATDTHHKTFLSTVAEHQSPAKDVAIVAHMQDPAKKTKAAEMREKAKAQLLRLQQFQAENDILPLAKNANLSEQIELVTERQRRASIVFHVHEAYETHIKSNADQLSTEQIALQMAAHMQTIMEGYSVGAKPLSHADLLKDQRAAEHSASGLNL